MAAPAATVRVKVGARERSAATYGIALMAPLLAWLFLTIALPLGYAVYLSLTDTGIVGAGAEFIGLDNYGRVLGDGAVLSAFGRSVLWAVGGAVVQSILAVATALVLNQHFRGRGVARTWVILSFIVPTIVIAILWRWMLNTGFGIVNWVLTTVGIVDEPVDFLGSASLALPTVVGINAWRWFPFLALIVLAGLSTIPNNVYDAARVDGASRWQVFRTIELPLLQPVLFVVGLLGTLWSFNIFDVIWLLTQGGPADATQTLPVLIYQRAFDGFALGEASAIAVLFALFLLVFSALYLRFVPQGKTEREIL
jgi:multiple sugar transport system permease protein